MKHHQLRAHPWGSVRPRHGAVALLVFLVLLGSARGELWQSAGWGLLGTATGRAGYDSNLTDNRDGRGDAFGTAEVDLVLKRYRSAALTRFTATLAETEFFSNRASAQFDAKASASLRYPGAGDTPPSFAATADWSRTTAADPEVNRRLTVQKSAADLGGRVLTSGKFGLNADLASSLYDYSADGLGRNHQTELRIGLAFDATPLTELSANLAGGTGASSGGGLASASVSDRSTTATLQLHGQISPKVTSTLYVGATRISYRGGFIATSTLPTSGGELVWEIAPGRSLRGGVSLSNGFAPDGETQRKSQETLDYRHALSATWSVDLLLVSSRYSDRGGTIVRTDTGNSAGAILRYAPSARFDVSLGASFLHQTSNLVQAGFQRHLTVLQIDYRL